MKFWYTTFGVLLLDQLTKLWILDNVKVGEAIDLISWFSIVHVKNTGISFGMLQGYPNAMIWITIAVIAFLFYNYRDLKETIEGKYAMGLILGGAVGNLIDRIWLGAVTDFVSIGWWPAFNVADTAICVGALLLAYILWED